MDTTVGRAKNAAGSKYMPGGVFECRALIPVHVGQVMGWFGSMSIGFSQRVGRPRSGPSYDPVVSLTPISERGVLVWEHRRVLSTERFFNPAWAADE
jgi:hypothetical protein